MRQLSASADLRQDPAPRPPGSRDSLDATSIEAALGASILIALAQGAHLLSVAGAANGWPATPQAAARVWREGSILRMAMLGEMTAVPDGQPLLSAPTIRRSMAAWLAGWRRTACWGLNNGLAIPVTVAGLAYWNGYQSARLPTALIQAQRDRFGDHGFERTDRPGIHHGPWRSEPT